MDKLKPIQDNSMGSSTPGIECTQGEYINTKRDKDKFQDSADNYYATDVLDLHPWDVIIPKVPLKYYTSNNLMENKQDGTICGGTNTKTPLHIKFINKKNGVNGIICEPYNIAEDIDLLEVQKAYKISIDKQEKMVTSEAVDCVSQISSTSSSKKMDKNLKNKNRVNDKKISTEAVDCVSQISSTNSSKKMDTNLKNKIHVNYKKDSATEFFHSNKKFMTGDKAVELLKSVIDLCKKDCLICKFESNSLKERIENTKSEKHETGLELLSSLQSKSDPSLCPLCGFSSKSAKEQHEHFNGSRHIGSLKVKRAIVCGILESYTINTFYCTVCSWFISNFHPLIEHMLSIKHNKAVLVSQYMKCGVIKTDFREDVYCTVCKCILNSWSDIDEIYDHLMSHRKKCYCDCIYKYCAWPHKCKTCGGDHIENECSTYKKVRWEKKRKNKKKRKKEKKGKEKVIKEQKVLKEQKVITEQKIIKKQKVIREQKKIKAQKVIKEQKVIKKQPSLLVNYIPPWPGSHPFGNYMHPWPGTHPFSNYMHPWPGSYPFSNYIHPWPETHPLCNYLTGHGKKKATKKQEGKGKMEKGGETWEQIDPHKKSGAEESHLSSNHTHPRPENSKTHTEGNSIAARATEIPSKETCRENSHNPPSPRTHPKIEKENTCKRLSSPLKYKSSKQISAKYFKNVKDIISSSSEKDKNKYESHQKRDRFRSPAIRYGSKGPSDRNDDSIIYSKSCIGRDPVKEHTPKIHLKQPSVTGSKHRRISNSNISFSDVGSDDEDEFNIITTIVKLLRICDLLGTLGYLFSVTLNKALEVKESTNDVLDILREPANIILMEVLLKKLKSFEKSVYERRVSKKLIKGIMYLTYLIEVSKSSQSCNSSNNSSFMLDSSTLPSIRSSTNKTIVTPSASACDELLALSWHSGSSKNLKLCHGLNVEEMAKATAERNVEYTINFIKMSLKLIGRTPTQDAVGDIVLALSYEHLRMLSDTNWFH